MNDPLPGQPEILFFVTHLWKQRIKLNYSSFGLTVGPTSSRAPLYKHVIVSQILTLHNCLNNFSPRTETIFQI